VVLIGGTSHTGKSTVARAVADRLGFDCLSTDGLARHPGRPWPTPQWQVPPHVDDHYRSLAVDELIASVLDHCQRLWPRIEELITTHALAAAPDRAGLVLEGSALLPENVAKLTVPHTAAVWLTADEHALSTRMHAASHYDQLPAQGRLLVDKFLARTLRYQQLVREAVARLSLDHIDTSSGRPPEKLAEAVLAAAAAQHAVGRSALGAASGDERADGRFADPAAVDVE
jgi:2-phosphoglycerate kinase